MSGPRRRGARTARAVAAYTLALIALSTVLLRGGVASAQPANRGAQQVDGGLLGGLLGSVGRTLHGTVDGLTGVLDPRDPAATPTSAPARSASPSPSPTQAPTSAPTSARTVPRPTFTRTAPRPSRPVPHAASSTEHGAVGAVTSASPVAHRVVREARPGLQSVTAIENAPISVPQLDLATSLVGLTIAMVLGVGLLVHRAGYRGERVRR